MTPDRCPHCGAEVPEGASACPGCGADEETGWSQSAHCDRLGIPDPDEPFDHGEFVRSEFGPRTHRRPPLNALWIITATILLILILIRWL